MTQAAPIRIVHIVRAPTGGIRKHILAIMDGLDPAQFDQQIATSPINADETFKQRFSSDLEFRKRVIPVETPDLPSPRDVVNLWSLYRRLKSVRPHILHGHGAKGGMYARILSRLIGTRSIYTAHGGSLHDMFKPPQRLIYSLTEKALQPLTDALVFESEYSRQKYFEKVAYVEHKAHLIPNGIKLPPLLPMRRNSDGPYIIAAFGMLRRIKGHDILIEAAAILKSRGRDIEVRIYGEGDYRQALEILIHEKCAESYIRIMGEVADVIPAMRECDLVVHPSRFESFGYVAVEAMALGKDVVASAVGGLKEVIRDGVDGILVPDLNPEAFAVAIESKIDQPETANLQNSRLHEVRSRFSELQMLEQLQRLYFDLNNHESCLHK